MKRVTFYGILFLCSVLGFAQNADKRPMTVDDAMNMVQVGGALISPDGNRVLFSKSELDWEKNRRTTKYFMIPADGGEAFQFVSDAGGSSFRFSPDGKYLTFKRSIDGKQQILWMRMAGGEAVPLTEHESSVGSYKWSADSSQIFFAAPEARSKEEEKKHKEGYDVIYVDEGPHGQEQGSWSNLWQFDVASKKESRVTDEEFIFGNFDVSPDGERIAFTARYTNRRNDRNKDELFVINVADKLKTRLSDNNAPEGNPLWAPDGKTFLYTAADDREWLNRNNKIWIMNPDTKEQRLLSGKYEGNIGSVNWTPGSRSVLFSGQQRTNTNLFRMDVASGDYQQLTNRTGTLRASSFSKDRSRFVYSYTDFDTPGDLYTAAVADLTPVRLTDANPWVEKELLLAKMELVQWQSKGDVEIEGLLHLPAGYRRGARVPLMLNIHGGPGGVFSDRFSAIYHIYAGLGYVSLSPNVRGSGGYTDKLKEGNTFYAAQDGIGLGDYHDLMNGVDYVIQEGYVDPERMALRGWSYGGILGGFTITQTDRFKAASIGAGVYDWTSEYGPGHNHDVRYWVIGGTPWDNPEAYRNQSALTHVKNVTTPTLLIHGMEDPTDKEPQSMMFFTALKDIGKVPVRYLRVPREPHGFREARHQRVRDIEEIQWMQKHVLGIDWTPWERKEEKKEKSDEPTP